MAVSRPYSAVHLILHSLVPSVASAIFCLFAGGVIVGLHILTLSLNAGTFLPYLFDGQVATLYTNSIVQPVQRLLGDSAVNKLFFVALWSIFGLLLYSLCAYISHQYHEYKRDNASIALNGQQSFMHHPQRHDFVFRLLWRLGIGVLSAILLFIAQPLFKHLLAIDARLFTQLVVTPHTIIEILGNVLIWGLIIHAAIVLLRLYLLKTRVFGEILY